MRTGKAGIVEAGPPDGPVFDGFFEDGEMSSTRKGAAADAAPFVVSAAGFPQQEH